MKNVSEIYKNLNHIPQAVILAAVMLSMAACATTSTTSPSSESPQLLFVQIAEDFKADTAAKTIRLVKVNQQTLYFSDRPFRIAGHLKMDDYLEEWTAKAGKDNFGANPPNAALSVYEAGKHDNTLVIVEVSDPQIDGSDLIYSYKLIEGSLPAMGGPTSLFIDRIGIGGGVGPGRRGVGVGRRGPGL
jgi:hypothetical protein